jgi:hypothetical protein
VIKCIYAREHCFETFLHSCNLFSCSRDGIRDSVLWKIVNCLKIVENARVGAVGVGWRDFKKQISRWLAERRRCSSCGFSLI